MSPACSTGWSGQPSPRQGTAAHLHLYWRLLFLGPVGRRWPPRSAEQDAGEEGPTALSCQGHGKWPVGWARLAEEPWHRRFSGHKAGPDSLPVHPPHRLPTSAESWLCPTGLGERSEARASKGPGKAERTLRATVCRPSSPPLNPGSCFSPENQGSEGLSSESQAIGSLSGAPCSCLPGTLRSCVCSGRHPRTLGHRGVDTLLLLRVEGTHHRLMTLSGLVL